MIFNYLLVLLTLVNSLNSSSLRLKEIIDTPATQAFCYVTSNGTFFDLNPLYNKTKDYSIINKSKNYTVNFNICNNAVTQCRNKSSLIVYTPNNQPDQCVSLSGAADIIAQYKVISKNINLN